MSKNTAVCPGCGHYLAGVIEEAALPLARKLGKRGGKLNIARDYLKTAQAGKAAAEEQVAALQARVATLEAENQALATRLAGTTEETRNTPCAKSGKTPTRTLTPAQAAIIANMR